MAFDLEGQREVTAQVDDARVLARSLEHVIRRGRQRAQEDARVLVGAVLGPERGEQPQLGVAGLPAETLARIKERHQVVFRYATAEGRLTRDANPNGSLENIAGVMNETGTVVGLMPHPERAAEAAMGGTDGFLLFQSLLTSLVEDGSFLPR